MFCVGSSLNSIVLLGQRHSDPLWESPHSHDDRALFEQYGKQRADCHNCDHFFAFHRRELIQARVVHYTRTVSDSLAVRCFRAWKVLGRSDHSSMCHIDGCSDTLSCPLHGVQTALGDLSASIHRYLHNVTRGNTKAGVHE